MFFYIPYDCVSVSMTLYYNSNSNFWWNEMKKKNERNKIKQSPLSSILILISKQVERLWLKSEFLKKFIQESGFHTINFKPVLFASSYSNLKERVNIRRLGSFIYSSTSNLTVKFTMLTLLLNFTNNTVMFAITILLHLCSELYLLLLLLQLLFHTLCSSR